jgi:putative oxidoreductase
MFGLFTRFWAAAAAIEMAIISYIYLKNGFSWLNRGYEYTLMWGLICFAISLRGGGPYSLDRKLGKEL